MPARTTPGSFWIQVDQSGGTDACWPYLGRRQRGYGRKNMGHISGAHRVAWTFVNGPIPAGLQIRHSCDNPPCCNPVHLLLGTYADNEADKKARGRTWMQGRSGEANSQARLSDLEVAEIRRQYAAGGVSHQQLALNFGIPKRHVWAILHNLRRKMA